MPTLHLPADAIAPRPLWRNPSFLLMWSSVAASGFGDRMIELAALPMLGVLAEDAQASAITAAIYFWFFLPYIFVSPIGGWLADTLPRKWVMAACDEGRAAILLLAVWMVPAGMMADVIPPTQAWKVYAILLAVGTAAAVFAPTRNALIPQIVPTRQLNPANAMIIGIGVIASLIGVVIGGWMLSLYPVRAAIFLGVLCYAVTGTFWAFVRPQPRIRLEYDRGLGAGERFRRATRYIARHRPVLRLVILNAVVWAIAMVVAPAIAALCMHRYGITEHFIWYFSLMSAMLGAGMLLGATWVAWMNIRHEADVVILGSLAVTAVCLSLLAFNPFYNVGLALTLMIGFCGGAVIILVAAITQAIVPNYILGRVSGVREVLGNISVVAVNLMIWQLEADAILINSLYVLSALLLAVVGYGVIRYIIKGPMGNATANFLWRLERAYVMVWHRLRWIGRENVPAAGPVILAANHTAGIDPLLMQAACRRTVRWVMLKSYQYRVLNFVWKAIRPIALEGGTNDLGKLRQILRELENGDVVGLFPEGALQREHRELQPFEPGVGMIAKRSGAMVVPVWIDGTPRTRRMIWHFLLPTRSTVIFGKPFKPDPKQSHEAITAELRRRMVELADALREQRNGGASDVTHPINAP